jgi:integrase
VSRRANLPAADRPRAIPSADVSVHRAISSGKRRYAVRWREAGRNRQQTFDKLTDAKAHDEKVRQARQRGDDLSLDRVTFEDFATRWFGSHVEANLAPRTIESYAHALDVRLIPRFGAMRLQQIRPAHVEEWIADMRRDGVGDPSILRAVAVLSGIMRRAQVNGVVLGNPVSPVRKPRQRASRNVEPIPPAVVEHIRSQLRPRDAMLVSLLAYAGLRPESEALTLRWSQVGDRTLTIPASLKPGGRERHVRLLKPLADDLKAWRGSAPAGGLVIPRESGQPWTEGAWRNWRRIYWKPAAKVAGIPDSRPRDLRGSFASLLIAEGRTVVETAAELGHSPAVCLSSYAKAFAEYDPAKRVGAEDQIEAARRTMFASRSRKPKRTSGRKRSKPLELAD